MNEKLSRYDGLTMFAIFRPEIRIPAHQRIPTLRRAKGDKPVESEQTIELPWIHSANARRLGNIPQLAKTIKSELSNCRHVEIGFLLEEESNTLGSSCTLPSYSLR